MDELRIPSTHRFSLIPARASSAIFIRGSTSFLQVLCFHLASSTPPVKWVEEPHLEMGRGALFMAPLGRL
jgi:hypothetical protein